MHRLYRNQSSARKDAYFFHENVLLTKDAKDQATSLKFFHEIFKDGKTPKHYKNNLITVFFDIGRDKQRSMDTRIDAVSTVTNLLHGRYLGPRHFILDKGAIGLFVSCLDTKDNKLREECLRGLYRSFTCCPQCRMEVRGTPVVGNETTRTAIVYAMKTFAADDKLLESTLESLERLIRVGGVRREPGLVKEVFATMASGNKKVIKLAKYVLSEILNPGMIYPNPFVAGSVEMEMLFIPTNGLLQLISGLLSIENARGVAMGYLSGLVHGSPRLFDHLVTAGAPIQQLMNVLRGDSTDQFEAFNVFLAMFQSLIDVPRPKMFTEFLGYGIMGCIVEVAEKWRRQGNLQDVENVDEMREMIETVLVLHPEWWIVVKRTGGTNWIRANPPSINDSQGDLYAIIDDEKLDF